MARTYNRRPVLQNGPDEADIKNYTFSYDSWKGICDAKDFLAVDQSTFADAENMYIDSEGLLSSRPSIKYDSETHALFGKQDIKKYYEYPNETNDGTISVGVTTNKLYIKDGAEQLITVTATSGVDYTDTKFFDTYDKLFIFNSAWIIYDKNLHRIDTAIGDHIYKPIAKTFTGSAETEGEQKNALTSAERYLYYYNDTTGIHSSAVGKTLNWDDGTITWDSDSVARLTKKHYTVGLTDPVTVAQSGAVAFVNGTTLNYALDGSILKSWDLSQIVDTDHPIRKISFTDTSDLIIVDIKRSENTSNLYVVSCLSTAEDGSLKYPYLTDIHDAFGIPESISEEGDYPISCYSIIDEGHFIVACQNATNVRLFAKFADSEILSTKGAAGYIPLSVDITKDYFALFYGKNTSEGSATTQSYNLVLYPAAQDSSATKTRSITVPTGNTAPFTTHSTVVKMDEYTINCCYPFYAGKDSNNKSIYRYYVFRMSVADFISSDKELHPRQIDSTTDYAYEPFFLYDNYGKVCINHDIYDFSGIDFTVPSGTATITSPIFTSSGILLPSTSRCFNYRYFNNYNHDIYTRFSTDTFELYYDVPGNTATFLPTDVAQLSSYYFAYKNKLYISEARYNDDGEFLFYLPEKNTNEFDTAITKLHQISEQIIAAFFNDCIYYVSYDSDAGTYRYYKTKLQYGLRAGNDVITANDSVTTIFATDRGIMALSYQDFMATSEQKSAVVSDAVYNMMKPLLAKTVKLFKYDFWIVVYCPDDTTAWVYDTRNGSWWKQKVTTLVSQLTARSGKPLVVTENSPARFDISEEHYTDVYRDGSERIQWSFLSQKSHLNSPNYFKSVQNMTFYGVADSMTENIFNLDIVNYRADLYKDEMKNVTYSCKLIRTFVYRLHLMKINELQFKLYSDDTIAQEDMIHPIKLSNLAVRYRITGQVR